MTLTPGESASRVKPPRRKPGTRRTSRRSSIKARRSGGMPAGSIPPCAIPPAACSGSLRLKRLTTLHLGHELVQEEPPLPLDEAHQRLLVACNLLHRIRSEVPVGRLGREPVQDGSGLVQKAGPFRASGLRPQGEE